MGRRGREMEGVGEVREPQFKRMDKSRQTNFVIYLERES
jgi:hypothetical protein